MNHSFKDGELREDEVKSFISLPNEKLIVAKRQHWVIVAAPLLFITALTLVLITILALATHLLLELNVYTFISLGLLMITASLMVVTKFVVDWYLHLYIVTSRKILEVICVPFFSDLVNDVFLEQVRATEVDARVGNLVDEILDIGDVVISFDRPSHDREFVLRNIEHPQQTATNLGNSLQSLMYGSPVWFKNGHISDHPKYMEDVYRGKS